MGLDDATLKALLFDGFLADFQPSCPSCGKTVELLGPISECRDAEALVRLLDEMDDSHCTRCSASLGGVIDAWWEARVARESEEGGG